MTGFDLTARPWIPVVVGGVRADVSLRDVLLRAQEIDELALDDSLEAVAVFRQVLLPVVLHALGVPRTPQEWADRWKVGCFDAGAISAYLDRYADRFDLFSPTQPFAQVADLRTANGETKPISLIIPQVASGNNVPLFSSRTESDPPELTPTQAARAVLAAHCWDTAAIKSGAVGDKKMRAGKTTGNPTGPLGQLGVVIPIGETLFQTLMLNVPFLRHGLSTNDFPQWAGSVLDANWESKNPSGVLDLLTWQSRRIRLVIGPEGPRGESTRISRVVLCAGDRIRTLPTDVEPHTVWKQVKKPKAGEPARRPDRHQPGRSAWRGLSALLATNGPMTDDRSAPLALSRIAELQDIGAILDDYPLRALVVGVVYGNQSAVIEDMVVDTIPLPVVALSVHRNHEVRTTLLSVVDQAEELRKAANYLGDDLRAALGVNKAPWDKGQRLGEILIHSFTPTVRRLLSGLQRRPDDAERGEGAWRQVARRLVRAVAEPALNAMPGTAFLGRYAGQAYPARIAAAEVTFRRRLREILGMPTNAGPVGPVTSRPDEARTVA